MRGSLFTTTAMPPALTGPDVVPFRVKVATDNWRRYFDALGLAAVMPTRMLTRREVEEMFGRDSDGD